MKELKNLDRSGLFSRLSVRQIIAIGAVGLLIEVVAYLAIHRGDLFPERRVFEDVSLHSEIEKSDHPTGAAWIDYDMDGDLDLITGSQLGIFVYNRRGNKFLKTDPISIGLTDRRIFVNGLTVADYNNDGCPDLYLAVASENNQKDRLYKNNCAGGFDDVTEEAGINDPFMSFGAAWGDYDSDGNLDLYVANYGFPLGPLEYMTHPNSLFRNKGDGTFERISGEAGITGIANCPNLKEPKILGGELKGASYKLGMEPKKRSYQPVWFDYDNDGDSDIFIATDTGTSPLYKNSGNGKFEEVTHKAGLCREASGMGVTIGDFNNDGWFDIYVTNTGANFLWVNQGDGRFLELAAQSGVANLVGLGWGVGAYDFNNDGWLDLYMVNGVVGDKGMTLEEIKQSGLLGETTSLADFLYINKGDGTFEDRTLEYGLPKKEDLSEAAAFADYDRNGFVDFYQQGSQLFPDQNSALWKNSGNRNRYLAVDLRGIASNRDGLGAKITLEAGGITQVRQVVSGSGFLSGSELTAYFGLRNYRKADYLKVFWPSGTVSEFRNVPTNKRITIIEGKETYDLDR